MQMEGTTSFCSNYILTIYKNKKKLIFCKPFIEKSKLANLGKIDISNHSGAWKICRLLPGTPTQERDENSRNQYINPTKALIQSYPHQSRGTIGKDNLAWVILKLPQEITGSFLLDYRLQITGTIQSSRGVRPHAPTENKTFSLFPAEPVVHED